MRSKRGSCPAAGCGRSPAPATTDALVLVRDEGPGTPVSASDLVLLCGGEHFASADADEDAASSPPSAVTPEFNGARDVRVEGGKGVAGDLVGRDDEVPGGRLFAVLGESPDEGVDVEIPGGATIVVQTSDSYFVVPHPEDAPDETIRGHRGVREARAATSQGAGAPLPHPRGPRQVRGREARGLRGGGSGAGGEATHRLGPQPEASRRTPDQDRGPRRG